jgi:hypothetical protein
VPDVNPALKKSHPTAYFILSTPASLKAHRSEMFKTLNICTRKIVIL